MKLPSVVCDPTVVIDALLRPDEASGRIIRRFLEHRDFELVSTEPLLEEIRLAATDREVLEQLRLGRDEVERWIVALGVLATMIEVEGAGGDATIAAARQASEVGDCVAVSLDPDVLAQPANGPFEAVRPEVLLEVLEARDAAGLSSGRAG